MLVVVKCIKIAREMIQVVEAVIKIIAHYSRQMFTYQVSLKVAPLSDKNFKVRIPDDCSSDG